MTLVFNPFTGTLDFSGADIATSNTWTGLQTFSRPGYSTNNISNAGQIVLNATGSPTYGLLALRMDGVDKAGLGWDTNGGMYALLNPFFAFSVKTGTDEIFRTSASGTIINGLGSGPSYNLDVRGTFGVSSVGAGSVVYISSTGQFVGDTNNLVYSDVSRFLGVNKSGPLASIHAGVITRTVGDVASLGFTFTPLNTGYAQGFGSKSYSVWGIRIVAGTPIQSVTAQTQTAAEPNASDYDANSISASETSGGGYDMSIDPPPSYVAYPMYDSNSCRGNNSVSFNLNSWSSGSGNTDVAVNIVPPNVGVPSGYLIIRNGTDYQFVTGSFTDSNTGWTGGTPSYSPFQWQINPSWVSATDASDYQISNNTDSYYLSTTSGSLSVVDDNHAGWTSGAIPSNPTSVDDTSFIADGTTYLCKASGGFSIFNVAPVGQQTNAVEFTTIFQNLGFIQASGAGSYDINVNVLTVGSTSNIGTATMSSFTSNGTSVVNGQLTVTSNLIMAVAVPSVLQITLVINNTSTGTISNVSTSGASRVDFSGASAQTITGYGNPSNGKFIVSANRAATTLVLKHLNGSSSSANQIITPTGLDYNIAPGSGYIMIEDPTSSKWRVHAISVVDLTSNVVGDLPFANLAQGSALSILGVAGNATADVASIAAGTDNQVLRRSGTSIGFGAVDISQAAAVTGVLARANGGTGQASAPIKFTHTADVNNSGTSETDLYSDTLAAGQLGTNGDIVESQYGGIITSIATSTQQLRVYFAGTLIFDSGALNIGVATTFWVVYVTVIRVSSSVVRCSVTIDTSFASLSASNQYTEVTGLTLANTAVLKITGTAGGVSGASNQITAKEGYVEYKPVA